MSGQTIRKKILENFEDQCNKQPNVPSLPEIKHKNLPKPWYVLIIEENYNRKRKKYFSEQKKSLSRKSRNIIKALLEI